MRFVQPTSGRFRSTAFSPSAHPWLGEDTPHHSFAGMHDSLLGLRGVEGVFDAVKRIWASAFSERALIYRRNQGIAMAGIGVAVIVQQLVDATHPE